MKYKIVFGVFVAFAALGLLFSASSAYDSISYLDREIHAISCSFLPGLGRDASGESGCYTVMMSPYSSVMGGVTWGGIPIALLSLSVFAYLLFLGIEMLVTRISGMDLRRTYYVIAAAALPALVSVIYLGISIGLVGDVCKTCIGIYIASFGVFIASVIGHKAIWREYGGGEGKPEKEKNPLPWGYYVRSFLEGVVFVVVPLVIYLAVKPAYAAEAHECGDLLHQDDPHGVMVPVQRVEGGVTSIEIVDPLCPACKLFRDRLHTSAAAKKLDLSAVVFPLEAECNWMVTQTLHPGACMVSEAVMCAGERGDEVIEWGLEHQEELRELATQGKGRLKAKIKEAFPSVAGCVGTTRARLKVNRSLRWIVSNSSRVMTPQLFINGIRLCDEDTDLGLEFALNRLIEQEAPLRGDGLRSSLTPPPASLAQPAENPSTGAELIREDETAEAQMKEEEKPTDAAAGGGEEPADSVTDVEDKPTDSEAESVDKPTDAAAVNPDKPADAAIEPEEGGRADGAADSVKEEPAAGKNEPMDDGAQTEAVEQGEER